MLATERRRSLRTFVSAAVTLGMVLSVATAPPAIAASLATVPPSGKVGSLSGGRSPSDSVRLATPTLERSKLPECPRGLRCDVSPAAYILNDPSVPTDYGNYDLARRPSDGVGIRYIVIHDTELSYPATLAVFADPTDGASSNYVIRSSDGHVTQTVANENVAWHAGNWYMNMHSIGIEIEGWAYAGHVWYTDAVYRSLARLIRYLAGRYGVPLDRDHIFGHDQVPGPTAAYQAGMHQDPGPYFDWDRLMSRVSPKRSLSPGDLTTQPQAAVTIAPDFSNNRPVITDCTSAGVCNTLPPAPASFVYLYTAPSLTAPLIGDPFLKGTSLEPAGVGTTQGLDWGDKAVSGQTFAVAGQAGDWTAIWYGGQRAWFLNPGGVNAHSTAGATLISPKAGLAAIPVYGRAYPSSVSSDDLGYTIQAGQVYVATELASTDYYSAHLFNAPQTYTVVTGGPQFYAIWFNHRLAYVKTSDVDIIQQGASVSRR